MMSAVTIHAGWTALQMRTMRPGLLLFLKPAFRRNVDDCASMACWVHADTATADPESSTELELGKCRTWVGKVSSLAADKLPELRHAAAEALAAVYHKLSRDALLSSILSAAPALQLTLRQALSGALPSLDAELQQASLAFHTSFQLGSPARKAPPSPAADSCTSRASLNASPTHSIPGETLPHLHLKQKDQPGLSASNFGILGHLWRP